MKNIKTIFYLNRKKTQKMKKNITIIAVLLSCTSVLAQNARVIGYLPSYKFSASSQIDYCKLTHLNICFANPDSNGDIIIPSISTVIADAKTDNPAINIFVSFAGAALTTQEATNWSILIDIPANRPGFIAKIVAYALANNLDGVDIDLEWSHVTSGYSDFIIELEAALNPHGILITSALPNQTLFENITQAALDTFDWINIMSYDATGPWDSSNPDQHSSYSFSQNGITFWKGYVSGSNLNLGLPFYGYDFVSSTTVNTVTYDQMVSTDISYADIDNVGNMYYNGRPTIEAKVALANNEVGGILIWELGQDAFNLYSLLTTIHDKYTSLGVTTTSLCGNEVVLSTDNTKIDTKPSISPNPTSGYLHISNLINRQHFTIRNTLGQQVHEGYTSSSGKIQVSNLIAGVYFLQIENKNTLKFIKK